MSFSDGNDSLLDRNLVNLSHYNSIIRTLIAREKSKLYEREMSVREKHKLYIPAQQAKEY